jgi:hypothetical protein
MNEARVAPQTKISFPYDDKFLTTDGVLHSEQKSFKSLQIEQIIDRFD